jgi:erythromycin esterase-like protein
MPDLRRMSRLKVLGILALFSPALLAPGRAWAQPVDLLNPDSVAEAAGKKKPPKPRGFPVLPGIYRLHGSAPGLPQDDLEPLRQIIGNARIVSLGESIHTSGGYYEMKHRVFRFLVEKMGFRAFAFESPWPDADRVGRYVETCGEPPEEALRGLFGVWQSAETRDLIQWMCDWNRSHRKKQDKLFFFGFDVQQPEQDGAALIAFLERLGVGSGDPLVTDIQACDGVSAPRSPAAISETRNQQCLQGLTAAEELINQAAGISSQDLEYARLRVVGLRSWQGEAYYFGIGDGVKANESRDIGMAYAFGVLRRLRYGDIKTVVWAHNYHIAKDAKNSSWDTKTMGSFLRETFGSNYVVLALIANIPEIDWPYLNGCGPAQVFRFPHYTESRLHELGYETLLLDLDFPGGKPPFLAPGERFRFSEASMVPAAQFDGAFFLERSRKMDPLRWPSCQ